MSDDILDRARYDAIYAKDTPRGEAHGWLQWKGTDACIDLHCACGHLGHVDADFLYCWECPACSRRYALGQVVRLIPLTKDEEAYFEERW